MLVLQTAIRKLKLIWCTRFPSEKKNGTICLHLSECIDFSEFNDFKCFRSRVISLFFWTSEMQIKKKL